MTTSHGRRIQSRRALAIMAWVSLVIIAGLLWYGQEKDIIRIQAWEPAALLLSAYAAFLAIFGWLLFAPQRKSAEESPALFFSGMLTLIPPCFIAYHLMPPSSPIRGWLTLGVFVFGLIAILSPLPDEVFAVPRDRKSYLQPLTDCYLSVLDVEEPRFELQSLVPCTSHGLTERNPQDRQPAAASGVGARDPWTDPFYGTGRQMSEVGSARRPTFSESRSRRSDAGSNVVQPQDAVLDDSSYEANRNRPQASEQHPGPSSSARSLNRPLQEASRKLTENQHNTGTHFVASPPPVPPFPQSTLPFSPGQSGTTRPPMTARSAFAPRESRTPNFLPSEPQAPGGPTTIDPLATSGTTTLPRRPLTDPDEQTRSAVGFQSAPASRPITSSPPPVPSYLAPAPTPVEGQPPNSERTSPHSPHRTPLSVPISDLPLGLAALGAAPSLASAATYDDVLKSAVSEFRSLAEPDSTLHELDRRMKELEADDERDDVTESITGNRIDPAHSSAIQSGTSSSPGTSSRLNDVRMERIKDEYGGEMIDGTIKVRFEAGQKRAHLHVPFSPPLPGLPEVECEPLSDNSVRLKVGVRQPYGIRIEARRSDAARALNTEIGFAAVYTPTARRT